MLAERGWQTSWRPRRHARSDATAAGFRYRVSVLEQAAAAGVSGSTGSSASRSNFSRFAAITDTASGALGAPEGWHSRSSLSSPSSPSSVGFHRQLRANAQVRVGVYADMREGSRGSGQADARRAAHVTQMRPPPRRVTPDLGRMSVDQLQHFGCVLDPRSVDHVYAATPPNDESRGGDDLAEVRERAEAEMPGGDSVSPQAAQGDRDTEPRLYELRAAPIMDSSERSTAQCKWCIDEAAFQNLLVGRRRVRSDIECAICCQYLGDETVALPCSRRGCVSFFHDSCIRPWLERKPNCPLCRCSLKHLVLPAAQLDHETAGPNVLLRAALGQHSDVALNSPVARSYAFLLHHRSREPNSALAGGNVLFDTIERLAMRLPGSTDTLPDLGGVVSACPVAPSPGPLPLAPRMRTHVPAVREPAEASGGRPRMVGRNGASNRLSGPD